MTGSYFTRLRAAAENVRTVLSSKGVHPGRLKFGGEGEIEPKAPWIPTDANSMFLGNRAMGDWAEAGLETAIEAARTGLHAVHYGDTDQIAAGDPGFRAHYLAEIEATRIYGKRPDLLLYDEACLPSPDHFIGKRVSEGMNEASRASAAIEVRSSKFKALRYMAVREREKSEGKKVDRESPSFTVKVEDLIIVYRWMERFGVPQSYMQVFLDCVYGINFLGLFEIIGSGTGFKMEKPRASQNKATIMVPITSGSLIAVCTEEPEFFAEVRETKLGRVDSYVVPKGGCFELDPVAFREIVLPPSS